ncbi:MAG: HEAT repeat domain-containing protein [Polyangiaceae bacterium]
MRARNPDAPRLVEALGPAAVEPLCRLAADPDWQVREVALSLLGGLDDAYSTRALYAALSDEKAPNRRVAFDALKERPALPASWLLAAFDAMTDKFVRPELALLLGRRDELPTVELERRRAVETHPRTRRALDAALAARGDRPSLDAVREFLERAPVASVSEALTLASYVGSRALIPALRARLADEQALFYVTGHPDGPEELRVCDLALMAACAIAELPYSYARTPANYTAEQRAEVRGALTY